MKTNRDQIILKPIMVLLINMLLSTLIVIGSGSSMNGVAVFVLAALVPAIYSTVVSYDLKKEESPILNYIIVFIVFEAILILLMVNHTFAAKLFQLFTGHFNLEATVFYLLYTLLPCTGGLFGFCIGYITWKIRSKSLTK